VQPVIRVAPIRGDAYWTYEQLKPRTLEADSPITPHRMEHEGYVLELKYDGWRVTLLTPWPARGVHGPRAFGRTIIGKDGSFLDMLPQIERALPAWEALPYGTAVEGELYVPGKPASAVPSYIKDGRISEMRFVTFGLPWYHGESQYDKGPSQQLLPLLTRGDVPTPALMTVEPSTTWLSLIKQARLMGGEGVVAKRKAYADWWKIKEKRTVDCLAIGFKDGDGKYLGTLGAIELGVVVPPTTVRGARTIVLADGPVCVVPIGNTSGMTDAERDEIDDNRKRYLGHVLEVEYQYVGAGGRLRHPRFVRWRDDKPWQECTADQLEE
jgi:hypothetical protein